MNEFQLGLPKCKIIIVNERYEKKLTNIKHLNDSMLGKCWFKPAKSLYIKNCPAVRVLSVSHRCSSRGCILHYIYGEIAGTDE